MGAMNNPTLYAIRPNLATIDLASHDGVGEATCPRCGVVYVVYVRHDDALAIDSQGTKHEELPYRTELLRIAMNKIEDFQKRMGKISPPNHDETFTLTQTL
jgi:hypothetical protein